MQDEISENYSLKEPKAGKFISKLQILHYNFNINVDIFRPTTSGLKRRTIVVTRVWVCIVRRVSFTRLSAVDTQIINLCFLLLLKIELNYLNPFPTRVAIWQHVNGVLIFLLKSFKIVSFCLKKSPVFIDSLFLYYVVLFLSSVRSNV